MPWCPSKDESLQAVESSDFWEGIKSVFAETCPLEPLPRGDDQSLFGNYISERKNDELRNTAVMRTRLEEAFDRFDKLGPTEIELIDFILHFFFR